MKNSFLTVCFQAFPSANVIFAGIGVLFSVGVFRGYVVLPIFDTRTHRRLKIPALSRASSLISSTASDDSLADSRFTLASRRRRL